ncbi:hypothetical protein F511_00905 [Dorcoceras hygrometricum]|nr:hypothetical protein F511_00905 [Dorcoceras hygrometricum]
MDALEEKLEIYQRLCRILEALNKVKHELKASHETAANKALLELQSASTSIISGDSHLFTISQHLSELSDLVQEYNSSKPSNHGIRSFIASRLRWQEFSRHSAAIKSEVESCIDREVVSSLKRTLSELRYLDDASSLSMIDEDKLCDKMSVLEERISRGFDINLQDILLRSGIFSELAWVLCSPNFSKMVREKAATTLQRLVLFNKDVFVGSVLVGGSVKTLVSMDSLCSLQVLSSLIKAIKSPLVDEIESCGGILKIVGYLSSEDVEMRIMALDCIMAIGYFGRKEAVEVMLKAGLIKRLLELQRSAMAANGIDTKLERRRQRQYQHQPFASCLARFAVQLEVGEGLRQREKRAFKQQMLDKVRECCVSDAESATIVAEVLWGSTP